MKFGDYLYRFYEGMRDENLEEAEALEIKSVFNKLSDVIRIVEGWQQDGDENPHFDKVYAKWIEFMQGANGMKIGQPPYTYDGEDWNLVGVDDDVLQVGIRASDGKLLAGGGSTIIGREGIKDTDGQVSLLVDKGYTYPIYNWFGELHSNTNWQVSSGSVSVFGMHTAICDGDETPSNYNFATGDFTDWTTSGSPVIESDDPPPTGSDYYVELSGTASIEITVTNTDPVQSYLIEVWVKESTHTNRLEILFDASNDTDLGVTRTIQLSTTAYDKWVKAYYIVSANSTTSPKFLFQSYLAGTSVYVGSIQIYEVVGFSSIGHRTGAQSHWHGGAKNFDGALHLGANYNADDEVGNVGSIDSYFTPSSVADDSAKKFPFASGDFYCGMMLWVAQDAAGGSYHALLAWENQGGATAGTTPRFVEIAKSTDVELSTSDLNGTTGNDNKITISAYYDSGSEIQVENRIGQTLEYRFLLI